MDQDTFIDETADTGSELRIESDGRHGYRVSIISPTRIAEHWLDAFGTEHLEEWLGIGVRERQDRLSAEVDRLADLVKDVAKRGGVMLAHRYEDGKERLFLPETDAEKQAEDGLEQTFKRQVEEAAEVLRAAGYKGGRTLAEQVGDAVRDAKRAKAELQGISEALDRGKVPDDGSVKNRVSRIVQDVLNVTMIIRETGWDRWTGKTVADQVLAIVKSNREGHQNAEERRRTINEVDRVLRESGLTKGDVVSRVQDVVGRGNAHKSMVEALFQDRENAVKSEERTRERMAALGDEFNDLQKRYHEANEMRMAIVSAAQDLAAAMGLSDGMESEVIRLACDRQEDITKTYSHMQKIGEALDARPGTKHVEMLPVVLERITMLNDIDTVLRQHGMTKGDVASRVQVSMDRLRNLENACLDEKERRSIVTEWVNRNLDTLNEYEKGLRLEGYSPDLDGLSSMRGDALRGRALGRLVAQIQRLRENHCPTMAFGINAADVAYAVRAEVDEVLNEAPGSEAAQREAAGVFAVACHLVMVEGSSLYEAMVDEEERLRHRLDWVEHGKTWEEAKELVAAGSFVATPATRFAGEFGDGEPPEEPSFAGGEPVTLSTLADGMVTEDHLARPGRWALVEAMGHAQYVGFARGVVGGLDVDCIDGDSTRRKVFGPQAIFAVTDLADEAEARLVASNLARTWRATKVIDPDLLKKPEPTERAPAPDGWRWDGDELRHEEHPDNLVCFYAWGDGRRTVRTHGYIPEHVLLAAHDEFVRLHGPADQDIPF